MAGAKDVGKTSLIRRFIHNTFLDDTMGTIGVDFMVKKTTYKEQEVSLTLWDFAGEHKFRSLFPKYISGASGALILCDITNHESFMELYDWMDIVGDYSSKIIKILVISKIDLQESAAITEEEISQFVREFDFQGVLKCSAKTGENVGRVFEDITARIIDSTLKACPHCHELIPSDVHFCTYCGREVE